jgi:hypothetical protein
LRRRVSASERIETYSTTAGRVESVSERIETLDCAQQSAGKRDLRNSLHMAWVYILRCADDSFYVGSTIALERRIDEHQSGTGTAYTRKRLPVTLVFATGIRPHR